MSDDLVEIEVTQEIKDLITEGSKKHELSELDFVSYMLAKYPDNPAKRAKPKAAKRR